MNAPRVRLTVVVVLAIIAIMLLEGVPGAIAASPAASAMAGTSTTNAQSAAGAAELAAASASLASGLGPAEGQSIACATAASETATCSAASALPGNIGSQKWEAEVAPSARTSSVMTYDGKDRYVLLFGGYNGSAYLNDTWEYTHGMWVQLAPPLSPSPRANATMAYDAADGYVVLFGGYNGVSVLSDTWKYVGGNWTQLSPATSPSARKDATMSYDTKDGYLVMFGGSSGTTALGDTWTFLKGTWTELSPSTSPSARWGSTSTFDAADNYVLLFGGYTGSSFLGDTWEFAGGQWTKLSPSTAPAARYESAMAYDPLLGYVVLFGGASASGSTWTAYGDTWGYVGGSWTLITPAPGVHPTGAKGLPHGAPAARQSLVMTYSTVDSDVVVFGGIVDGDPIVAATSPSTQVFGPTDTWSYTSAGWTQILSAPEGNWAQLPGRVGAAIAFDPTAKYDVGSVAAKIPGYAVAFGGSTAYGPNAETWVFLGEPSTVWSLTFPTTSPSARSYAAMTYDAKDGYVLMFGGMNAAGTALGDTWSFQNGNWTELHPTTSPAARYGAMMAYDVADGYVVLFGGADGSTYYSDTWTFSGGVWTEVTNIGGAPVPSARAFGGLAWDNVSGYVALFGGTTGTAALADTWKFLAGSWTELKLTTSPPAEWGMAMVADGKDNDVFLFGGCTSATVNPLSPSCPSADTQGSPPWQFRAVWATIAVSPRLTAIPAAPEARFLEAGVFIATGSVPGVTLVLGGMSANGALLTDRWVYESKYWNPWSPRVTPEPRYGAISLFDDLSRNALMFGGIGAVSGGGLGYLDDTWEWDTGMWGADNSPVNPSARAFGNAAFFGTLPVPPNLNKPPKSYNLTVMFGGIGPTGYLSDTWTWVGAEKGGHWTELHPTTSPSARSNMSMAYDAVDNEIVLFGGQNAGGYLGDTWVFSLSGQWTEIFPSVSPSARAGAAMVYDSEDKYVVLFGGRNSGGALGDTWKFVGGAWTELTPSSSPSPRYGADIIDCPSISAGTLGEEPEVVLLVGGTNGTAFFGDTWAFSAGQWTVIPNHVPSVVPFAFGAISNDIDDGHPSIFSGLTAGGLTADFWEFKLGS